MTKKERKGLLVGIGLFSILMANYANQLVREPVYAIFLGIMLFALVISFVIGTMNGHKGNFYRVNPKPIPVRNYSNEIIAKKKKIKKQKIEKLRRMDPYEFEEYVRDLLITNGFKRAQCTSRSNDGGKDIIATDEAGKLVFVECKRHDENNRIGRPLIQKFHSALVDGKADYGLFVTTSYFNKNAVKYARDKKIELIDARILCDMIENLD